MEVAKAVGVGAIIFNDLKNERHLDVDFNLANMLKFKDDRTNIVLNRIYF